MYIFGYVVITTLVAMVGKDAVLNCNSSVWIAITCRRGFVYSVGLRVGVSFSCK